jgi:hypothetical protein
VEAPHPESNIIAAGLGAPELAIRTSLLPLRDWVYSDIILIFMSNNNKTNLLKRAFSN